MQEKIFHCSAQNITRSKGVSAVQKGAYRVGQNLSDELTEQKYSYENKGKKEEIKHFTTLPVGASEKWNDPQYYFNAIEITNTNKDGTRRNDARLMKEVEVSGYTNLTPEQNEILYQRFAQKITDKWEVPVMVGMHKPNSHNPHAHIVYPDKKIIDDELGGKKIRELDKKAWLHEVRKEWADISNQGFKEFGVNAFVDHRSHKDRGLDREKKVRVNPNSDFEKAEGITKQAEQINKQVTKINRMVDYSESASQIKTKIKQEIDITQNTRQIKEVNTVFERTLTDEQTIKRQELVKQMKETHYKSDEHKEARKEVRDLISAKSFEDEFGYSPAFDKDVKFDIEEHYPIQSERAKLAMSANQYASYHKAMKQEDPAKFDIAMNKLTLDIGSESKDFVPQHILDAYEKAKEKGIKVEENQLIPMEKSKSLADIPQVNEPKIVQAVEVKEQKAPESKIDRVGLNTYDNKLSDVQLTKQRELTKTMMISDPQSDAYKEARTSVKSIMSADQYETRFGQSAAFKKKDDFVLEDKYPEHAKQAKEKLSANQYANLHNAIQEKDPAKFDIAMEKASRSIGHNAKDYLPKQIVEGYKEAKVNKKEFDINTYSPGKIEDGIKKNEPTKVVEKEQVKVKEKEVIKDVVAAKQNVKEVKSQVREDNKIDQMTIAQKKEKLVAIDRKMKDLVDLKKGTVPLIAITPKDRRERQERIDKATEWKSQKETIKKDIKQYESNIKERNKQIKGAKQEYKDIKKQVKEEVKSQRVEKYSQAAKEIINRDKVQAKEPRLIHKENQEKEVSVNKGKYKEAQSELKTANDRTHQEKMKAKELASAAFEERMKLAKEKDELIKAKQEEEKIKEMPSRDKNEPEKEVSKDKETSIPVKKDEVEKPEVSAEDKVKLLEEKIEQLEEKIIKLEANKKVAKEYVKEETMDRMEEQKEVIETRNETTQSIKSRDKGDKGLTEEREITSSKAYNRQVKLNDINKDDKEKEKEVEYDRERGL
jgi:hypothetical protein